VKKYTSCKNGYVCDQGIDDFKDVEGLIFGAFSSTFRMKKDYVINYHKFSQLSNLRKFPVAEKSTSPLKK
jgi:hypothetical protein